MPKNRLITFAVLLISTTAVIAGEKQKARNSHSGIPQMEQGRRAVHALNRFTFGPRPGEAERVEAMGVDRWFEQQLHPEKIDDHALDARLAGFRTLNMDARALFQTFPPPQVARMVENGRASMPRDPEKRAVYEAMIAKYDERKQNKQDTQNGGAAIGPANSSGNGNGAADAAADDDAAKARRQQQRRELRQDEAAAIDRLNSESPDRRYQDILRMSPDERARLLQALNPDERQEWMSEFNPRQKETMQALQNPQAVVVTELQQAKILRAAYSDRQLEEVMTDFWFNHFNVFINKNLDRYYVTEYEYGTIRPHALGKFKELLVATAKSPAMLLYLDNAESVGPHSAAAEGRQGPRYAMRRGPFGPPVMVQRPQPQQKNQKKAPGLNENYGRELMELHTLGVDGGYTQKDVTEVAKVFTGWTVKGPRDGGSFDFEERRHEPGDKFVLGHKIKGSGEKEGMEVLEMLARHPSTAHFICKKLAIRFVGDDPPEPLVRRMADRFLKTDGDIREVLRTMFQAPEFWAPEAYRAKIKTPFEFVVSAIRSTGADVQNAMPLVQTLNRMGMPLYQMQPPTGYSAKNEAWESSSALLNRINFSLALGSGHFPGASVDADALFGKNAPPDAPAMVAALEEALLAGDVSAKTHATILKQVEDPQKPDQRQPGMIAALIVGSPEFQKR
ncbi:MAG: DUF1800 domain-containing protein [Acidobacteria bacterium]|nr:DUF1800 domain-containing protein [Acidobacteriota bacterium]